MIKYARVKLVCDGNDIFVVVGDTRIAKRGMPGRSRARKWISLVPGYSVSGNLRDGELFIDAPGEPDIKRTRGHRRNG